VISFKLTEKDTRDEILKAFKLFDKDQTGFITFENLQQIATELGEGLNDEEIKVSYNCAIIWINPTILYGVPTSLRILP
jgi:hypothetical protein